MRNSNFYLEFGCGNSTELAANYVKNRIVSIDSSQEWINKTRALCNGLIEPEFHYADIGPIGNWGTPIDDSHREKWTNYTSIVWNIPEWWNADLFLIDGRFRVACFARICLHCHEQSVIAVHDFTTRLKHYEAIRKLGHEITGIGALSFFLPTMDNLGVAKEILLEYQYNYR